MKEEKSPEQKGHELAVGLVAEHLGKSEKGKAMEIVAASVDRGQDPQLVAHIDGVLTFILVRVARYPEEASLDEAVLESFRPHAASHGAEPDFAPVGLWPTGDRDEAGNEGFYVKFEGIQRL